MGNSKWIVVAGLALVAAAAPGCKSSKCEEVATTNAADGGAGPGRLPTMTAFPGVVEIYRYGEGVVGYVSNDSDPSVSWWLLKYSETPPVMPRSTSWSDDVIWRRISTINLPGEELCFRYGMDLGGARLWRVTDGTWTDCGPAPKTMK